MGRPLNKRNFGNITGSGSQLQLDAVLTVGAGLEKCWIVRQRTNHEYDVASVAGGATPLRTGRVRLIDSPPAPSVVGDARLSVTPIGGGAGGTQATATTTMQAVAVESFAAPGTGYLVGDTITLADGTGTSSTAAIITIATSEAVTATDSTQGSGYAADETLILTGGAFNTVATFNIDTVGGGGEALTFSVTAVGDYTTEPGNPVSTSGGSGTLAELTVLWGALTATVTTAGDYTALDTDPVAQDATSGGGTTATVNVDWGILAVTITDAGAGYGIAPAVSFSGGTGSAASSTITGDIVTAITATVPGVGHTATSVVTVAAPGGVEMVRSIHGHKIKTFEGNVYNWQLDTTATLEGQADPDKS